MTDCPTSSRSGPQIILDGEATRLMTNITTRPDEPFHQNVNMLPVLLRGLCSMAQASVNGTATMGAPPDARSIKRFTLWFTFDHQVTVDKGSSSR